MPMPRRCSRGPYHFRGKKHVIASMVESHIMKDGGTEENLDYYGVCGALRHLGLDLSWHPFCDRNDSAIFDGGDALFSRRRDHVRHCPLAGRSKSDMGGVAG